VCINSLEPYPFSNLINSYSFFLRIFINLIFFTLLDPGPRLAMPVCWEPRERRTLEVFHRKLRLAALGLPSTHWASLGRQHNLTLSVAHRATSLEIIDNDPEDIHLACVSTMVPDCILPGIDYHGVVLPLCNALMRSEDVDVELAEQLKAMLKPEVVASI